MYLASSEIRGLLETWSKSLFNWKFKLFGNLVPNQRPFLVTAGGETYEAGANTSSECDLDDTEGLLYGPSRSKFRRKEAADVDDNDADVDDNDADVDDDDDADAPSADFKISGNFCRLGFWVVVNVFEVALPSDNCW